MRTVYLIVALILPMVVGCDSKPKEQDIPITGATDALGEAKNLLKRYADGQPMSSEASSFPKLVEDVKAIDANKGAILEKGFDNLQKTKGSLKSAAKELLSKL